LQVCFIPRLCAGRDPGVLCGILFADDGVTDEILRYIHVRHCKASKQ